MKIKLGENGSVNGNERYSLKRSIKSGIILAIAAGVGSLYSSCDNRSKANNSVYSYEISSINTSIEDINSMNIIINNDDCSDVFFQGVCDKLDADGIKYTISNNEKDINVDNSVVITLDQQYNSGMDTLIFAPYDNTRLGNSDSLTLAMYSSFPNSNEIIPGKTGFREDENGNVSRLIPTETEEAIDSNYDTSFVTISLGTQNISPNEVAESLEEGLAKQKFYLDNYDSNTDLLYRTDSGESIDVIAEYFNSDAHSLTSYNNIFGNTVYKPQVIINPNVNSMGVFNKNVELELEHKNKTH